MVGAGLACLTVLVLVGLIAHRRATWLDQAAPTAARRLLAPDNALVQALSSEAYWPHGAYLTALLPVAAALVHLAGEAHRYGVRPVIRRWRWVVPTAVAVPLHYVLRVAFGRPGPGEGPGEAELIGAYPSGAALAVGLGWGLCIVVVGASRPRWRPWLAALAAAALFLHAGVRVVTDKHWTTDILGSYLLVTSAFLLAGAARPRSSHVNSALTQRA